MSTIWTYELHAMVGRWQSFSQMKFATMEVQEQPAKFQDGKGKIRRTGFEPVT